MKMLFFAALAGLALARSAALAADLNEQPPSVSAPPARASLPSIPTWTGFYVGINAGLRADKFELPYQVGAASGNLSVNTDRGIGGVQVGYNWQFWRRWFVGLEADLDGSDIEQVRDYTSSPIGTITAGTNLDWFGTVRPRLGFAVTPTAIVYLTGGWVFGHTTSTVTTMAGISSFTDYDSGWARGGGLEYALTDWLSFKTEYIYLNLGRSTFSSPPLSIRSKMIAHMLRAGLNFKLGPIPR